MKIIQVVNNRVWGGGEQYVLNLSRALSDDGYELTVVVPGREAVRTPFQKSGLETATINIGGAFDIFSPVKLRKLFDGEEAVIIHCHNFKQAVIAARARRLSGNERVKIVVTRHLAKRGKNSASYKSLYQEIDKLIFVSDFSRKVFLEGDPEIPKDKITVLPTGIPDVKIGDGNVKREAGRTILMSHGRVTSEKGLNYLIEALGMLKRNDYILKIAGEGKGTEVMPLIKDTRKYGIDKNIDWLGFRENVAEDIATADIGVFPSVAPEAFGLSLLEYMRAGKAVISTCSGAQEEIIRDGEEGMIVKPGDSRALAEALERLLDNPSLVKKMSEAARKRYEETFSFQRFYGQMKNIYRSLF